jgi:hypothetical protein
MFDNFINKAVALGEDIADEIELEREPQTIEERLRYLEQAAKQHTLSLDSLYTIVKEIQNGREQARQIKEMDKAIEANKSDNKIPVGTRLKGITRGTPFWCVVKEDGFYVGIHRYESLSAAAQSVSGVRRSGWAFWKFEDGKNEGKSVKEVYK